MSQQQQDDSKVCQAIFRLLQEGKFADAAQIGELMPLEDFSIQKLSPSYYALLAAAHLANGSFPAARLAVVRGNTELADKSLDFMARILDARNKNRYSDAVNALKSAPEGVRGIFQDILVCELSATTASTYHPPSVQIVAEVSGVAVQDVQASLSRMGRAFGVALDQGKGLLSRVQQQQQQQTSSGSSNSDNIASIKLVTDAALMTAQPVDRYWRN